MLDALKGLKGDMGWDRETVEKKTSVLEEIRVQYKLGEGKTDIRQGANKEQDLQRNHRNLD